eukprot:TRINITY_DN352_c0_g1_i1.p1 TRINITY_DN352_c0_g1~~TRINITY_DN352_c0_g1_i1.p1  ORF type:complete len:561 (-),score=100.24 TRINITY_DN352_c0_g1_i1:13-1695(-)
MVEVLQCNLLLSPKSQLFQLHPASTAKMAVPYWLVLLVVATSLTDLQVNGQSQMTHNNGRGSTVQPATIAQITTIPIASETGDPIDDTTASKTFASETEKGHTHHNGRTGTAIPSRPDVTESPYDPNALTTVTDDSDKTNIEPVVPPPDDQGYIGDDGRTGDREAHYYMINPLIDYDYDRMVQSKLVIDTKFPYFGNYMEDGLHVYHYGYVMFDRDIDRTLKDDDLQYNMLLCTGYNQNKRVSYKEIKSGTDDYNLVLEILGNSDINIVQDFSPYSTFVLTWACENRDVGCITTQVIITTDLTYSYTIYSYSEGNKKLWNTVYVGGYYQNGDSFILGQQLLDSGNIGIRGVYVFDTNPHAVICPDFPTFIYEGFECHLGRGWILRHDYTVDNDFDLPDVDIDGDVDVNNSTVTLSGNFTSSNLDISSSILDIKGKDINIKGNFVSDSSTIIVQLGQTIKVGGCLDIKSSTLTINIDSIDEIDEDQEYEIFQSSDCGEINFDAVQVNLVNDEDGCKSVTATKSPNTDGFRLFFLVEDNCRHSLGLLLHSPLLLLLSNIFIV